MSRGKIYAGARAILIEYEPHKYRIVELIKEKVNLLEDGLFFAVRDVKTGEMIGAEYSDLRFGSRKRDKEDEDCDDEYVYYYPDPFIPNTFRDDATDCFSGVIFYGK